jgi:hypothetical protein
VITPYPRWTRSNAVSIEPIGSVDSNTTPLIELQQLFQMTHVADRRSPADDVSDLQYLSAGDREFLAALYGPGILATDPAAGRFETPQFLLDVIADRKDGLLPLGTELTSTYVQAKFDRHVDLNGTVTNPLTEQNLLDAQAYFNDRVQGAAIDLKA